MQIFTTNRVAANSGDNSGEGLDIHLPLTYIDRVDHGCEKLKDEMNGLKFLLVMALVELAGCGGGGGGTAIPVVPLPPPAAGPIVSIALSSPKVSVGAVATVTWTSTDATSCTGSDSLSGSEPTSGSSAVTTTAGGQFKYTISCSGAGGSATQSVSLTVPMPVYPTSYENKNSIVMDNPKVPSLAGMGIPPEAGELGLNPRAMAFADFTQSGGYSAIVVSVIDSPTAFPAGFTPPGSSNSPAKIYFLQRDAAGNWQDITSTLLKDLTTRYVCVNPSFIEIADINNDGKPDAFISCTGIDFTPGIPVQDLTPYWLAPQYVVLSQPDGTYKVAQIPGVNIYAHQSALADIDGDGNVDIVTVDPHGYFTPFILWGHGDGSFTQDMTRFPADMLNKAIYGIDAVPLNGKIKVFVHGNVPGSTATSNSFDYGTEILQYVNGSFQYVQDLTPGIPNVTASGFKYGQALDYVYSPSKNVYYSVRGQGGGGPWNAVIRTDAATGASTVLNETLLGTDGRLKITTTGNLIYEMAGCDPGTTDFVCTFSIPAN